MQFVTNLRNILILPGSEPLDGLSAAECESRLAEVFYFLPKGTRFEVVGEVVTITIPEPSVTELSEGERLAAKAEKRAQQGEYEKAKSIYERVLELTPGVISSRRNLAMVCYELGAYDEAKDHLIEALRLDPTDAWSYVTLGNLYIRDEGDKETATKFFKKALELKSEDPWALNGLATATSELGDYRGSIQIYDRAIAAEPRFANAYLGKAMALAQLDDFQAGATTLEQLFKTAEGQDVRSQPVFGEARNAYVRLENIIANNKVSESFKVVEDLKNLAAIESGYPVRVETGKLEAQIAGTAQMAWKHRRDYHRLILRDGDTPDILKHHVSVHELQHVLMEAAARRVGTNRWFTMSAENRENAIRSLAKDIRRMERKGYDADTTADVILKLVSGAAGFLFNCPLDMIIETTIRRDFPALREAQFCGVFSLAQEARNATFHEEIRKLSPNRVLELNDTLNGVYSLFVDQLFEGATAFTTPYRKLPTFRQSEKLFQIWREMSADRSPGHEYTIVDAFARELGIRDWYSWQEDSGTHEVERSLAEEVQEGTTNPALLKTKAPASVMFLLDALQRFEDMSESKIREILSEVAIMGMSGLDYASADKKYRLKSLSDASFSGLHLMCLMYAASQRLMPGESVGMDLNDEYLQALELYRPKN